MGNDLAKLGDVFGALAQKQEAGALATSDMDTGGNWLPRIQIAALNSGVVAEGHVGAGHFYVPLGNDRYQDLGDSIDLIAFVIGPKAIDFSESPPIENYDPTSKQFKDIERRAPEKDSKCQAGRRILVFERSTAKFYEWFCGNASQKRESAAIRDRYMIVTQAMIDNKITAATETRSQPIPFTVKTAPQKNKKGRFYVPVSEPCLTPFKTLPTMEEYTKAIELYENAGKVDGEIVPDEQVEGRRAR